MKILNWIACLIGSHQWTCAAKEGIAPTAAQLEAGVVGFHDYAKMYCKRCGAMSTLNKR